MTWIRALAAAGLSMFFPGAGHALIRDWVRAFLFAGLFVSAVAIFLPTDQLSAAGSVTAAMEIVDTETSMLNQLFFSFVVVFAAVDSAFRAMGVPPVGNDGDDGLNCPHCGKELDEDLEFCHWCTTRIEYESDETAQ